VPAFSSNSGVDFVAAAAAGDAVSTIARTTVSTGVGGHR
jgi:hypothetical protein